MAVLDVNENVCAFFDNVAKNAMHYKEACLHTYLQGSAYTLEIETDTQHEDTQYLVEGNKIAFIYKGRDYMFNMVNVERTETTVSISCWGLLLELTNESRHAYKSNGAMTFVQYLNYFDHEHVLTLGVNEVSDKAIANEWEGSQTILARLYSIANVFSAELEFITELHDDYSLKQIKLNVYRKHDDQYQGMGQKRTDQVLRFGKAISTIRKTSDITELYTAIRVYGKDGVDLSGVDRKEYDEDGNLEFYTANAMIYAPMSRDRFPSNVNKTNDKYITYDWEYDSDSKETLYGQGLAMLKKYCVPKVSYEIEGYYEANIGDTFTIEDDAYKPTLLLEARVTEQEEYFVDPTKNKTTYSNATELESQIDSSLLAAMKKLVEERKSYTCNISTDNGIVFRNGLGSTTLTAQVREGVKDITDNYEIQWYKDGHALIMARSVKVDATDVSGKSVYKFTALDSKGAEIGSYEVTVTNINDGQDGEKGERGVKGEDSILLYIESVNGNIFKNTGVATTLTVTVIAGENWIDNSAKLKECFGENAYLQWKSKRFGNLEYMDIPRTDYRLADEGFIFTLNTQDVDVKTTFHCNLIL